MPERSDNEILDLFHSDQGKEIAFSFLVEKYQQRIYFCIRRIVLQHDDAHDVMQNVFIKVWNSLGNFKSNSALFTWLYRIAVNESLSHLSSKNRRTAMPLLSDDPESGEQYGPALSLQSDPYFDGDELQLLLQQAIAELPEKQRLVFNMRYYDELSYEQISELLGTSVGALKASYFHAARKIEERIKSKSE